MFDAYNIRKIAPRMLLAVIGVNLSIYLCVAAVDIINVIGGGLGSLIRGPFIAAGEFDAVGLDTGASIVGGSIIGIVGAGTAGSLAAAGGGAAATGFMGSMLAGAIGLATAAAPFILIVLLLLILSAILIALAVMATIVVRYGAIILLTLVSPVAIALLVLPGTEKYFRRWWEYFLKTLMVYPIIAAIFAVSDVMAAIFLKAQAESGGIEDLLTIFIVIVVVYAPLFMIPFSFKLAGGFLGSIYDFANKNMYGRAKPRMDKWKEKEGGMYATARGRASRGAKRAGLHPETALKKGTSFLRGFNKNARERRRAELDEHADNKAFLEEYAEKVRNGTATQADFERASKLTNQGFVNEDGSVNHAKQPTSLFRGALMTAGSEGGRYYASEIRNAAIKAEEADLEVKDIQGNDDIGKAIRGYLENGINSASSELRRSNPFEYDYNEGGLSEQERTGRKRSHDQALNQIQSLQERYGDDVLSTIGARQDARASTGSDAVKMREDAIRAAGGKALSYHEPAENGETYVKEWDTSKLDTVSLARNLDDLRGFAKEAQRLDKAGIGFSGDLKAVQSMIEGGGSSIEGVKNIKAQLLQGALDKNSASTIATMHDKGIAEIQEVLTSRIRDAKDSGNDAQYQRAIAEAANLYDAFQYAAPKNMDKLAPLIGSTSITRGGNPLMEEIEVMRGQMQKYAEFAKYRKDWGTRLGDDIDTKNLTPEQIEIARHEAAAREAEQRGGGQGNPYA